MSRLALFLLVALAAPVAAQPCTHIVDGTSGNDTHAGTSAAPWATLTRAADAVGAGATVCIAAGVYYETLAPMQGGQPGAPVTFRAADGADGRVVISGAEALPPAAWVRDGADWRWDWAPRPGWSVDASGTFPTTGNPDHGAPHVIRRELLVARSTKPPPDGQPAETFDGFPLRPVATRDSLGAYADDAAGVYGTFWVQTGAGGRPVALYARFHDGRSPAEAQPMLAVREHGVWPGGAVGCGSASQPGFIALRGLVVRHTNNAEQIAAVCPGREGGVLDGVTVTATNGLGLALGGGRTAPGRDHTFRRVRVVGNGQLGAGGACHGCVMEDSEIAANNWKGYHVRWEAGGLKLSWSTGTVLRRIHSHGNHGPGLWLDEGNRDNVVEGCRVMDNDDVGLFLELFSVRTLVQHNLVAGTRRTRADDMSGTGLLVQAAGDNALFWNTVVGNDGNGVFDRADWRVTAGFPEYSDFTWTGLGTHAFNNVVAGNARSAAGLYGDEAHEWQVADLTDDWTRTVRLGGNRVMTHASDLDGLQEALAVGWDAPAFYAATDDLAAFRQHLALPQPDGQALLPFSETAYDILADLSRPAPDYGASVGIPLDAPCFGPACLVRCGDRVGVNREALTGDFLDRPDTVCRVGAVGGEGLSAAGGLALRVAPNPAMARAAVSGIAPGPARLDVFDALGRRVATATRTGGDAPFVLDVRAWATGIYAVRVVSGGTVATARFTVSR